MPIANRIVIAIGFLSLFLFGCQPQSLPTIGRTHGDLPMSLILSQNDTCWTFKEPVYFDTQQATGMSFNAEDCLSSETKIGRNTVAEWSQKKVSMTYDGEYYIIKSGY